MSEELEVGNGNGANGATNSDVSPAKPIDGALNQSQVLLDIQKQLDLTRRELQGLQGRQDKETNEVQRFMGEIEKRIAKGMSYEEAKKSATADAEVMAEKELLRMIAKKVGVLDESPSNIAGNDTPVASDKASTLKQYNLDANDPDVAEAIRGESDPLKVKLAALEVAYKRATKPVADASAAASVVGRPTPPVGVEENTKKYVEEIKAASGKGSQFGNAIKDKYRNLGVPVDEITFKIS